MEKTDKASNPNHNKNKKSNQGQEYLKYSGLAFQMIAVILVSWWVGQKIDEWVQSDAHIFTIVFILVGIIGSLVVIIISAYNSKDR